MTGRGGYIRAGLLQSAVVALAALWLAQAVAWPLLRDAWQHDAGAVLVLAVCVGAVALAWWLLTRESD